jgi:hypothetical protein
MAQGLNAGRSKKFFSSLKHPERLWGPTHIHIKLLLGFFPQGRSRQGVMLTTHIHTVLRVRMSGVIPLIPLNAVMMSTWTTDTVVLGTCQIVHKFLCLLLQMLIQFVITSVNLEVPC